VVCRPTQKEAEDYYRYATIEMADWGSVERMLEIKNLTRQTLGEEEYQRRRLYFASLSIGGFPFVGTPDRVAEQFADFARGGVRGVAFSQVNYLKEFPYFRDEVLPRLERMGMREKR
jgi:alkanesulfonate monooxygenase SsuD/methylene tetrahydromethanopterin reductase-like flavin-dependent oxidoreductase (luciferase family)